MGVGSKLYGMRPGIEREWQLIGDLGNLGIENISRLAIGPKMRWLAIVNTP
jgi:hypothetical protein